MMAHLGPHARDGDEQLEEAQLLGRPEAVQRLEVLADQVVDVELGRPADRETGERPWATRDPVPDAAHLEHHGVAADAGDRTVEGRDHAAGR